MKVTGSFDSRGVQRMVDDLAKEAVRAAARAGAETAHLSASARVKTGAMRSIRIEPVRRSKLGWFAGFHSPVKHAWYQNDGTLGNRKRKLRQAPSGKRSRAPGTGVKPLHFLYYGLGVGRKTMYHKLGIRGGGRP